MNNQTDPKTFNFYCDESCYLEHDDSQFMLIGYVSSAFNQVKMHNRNIRQLKNDFELETELKWNKLSKSSYPLFSALVDYFFATDLQYRAIVVNKKQLRHEDFDQDHDTFYYKMYYQLLNKKLIPAHNYNIYLDLKDSRSAKKVNGLREYLNAQYVSVRTLQNIRSHESELLQLADILTGAIGYHVRGLNKVIAKNKLIDKIQAHSNLPLNQSTLPSNQKFNLFFIDLK